MRTVNPEQLEELAKLLDGRGGTKDKLDEAFTRARNLDVSDKLTTLKPIRSWLTDTAPDLRKRAAIARAENGDPLGGLLWAGFSKGDAGRLALHPDIALLAMAGAASGDRDFEWLKREKNESFSQWATRVRGEAVGKLTNNKKLGETVSDYIKLTGMTSTVPGAFKMVATGTLGLIKYYKPGTHHPLKAPGTTLAQILRGRAPSYIPKSIAKLGIKIGTRTPAPLLDFLAGSNKLAQIHGGKLWAWEANLLKTGKSAAALKAAGGAGKFSSLATGLGVASKTAGFWRVAGVGGSAAATVAGAVDVIQQGNPVDAFKKNGAGYVADVSGVAFNASLTAAMVAPNPVTIGAAVVTGAVYGVATIVDNWDTVKKFPGKVADGAKWAGNKVKEGVGNAVDGAKKLGSKLNPFD
ncbi:mucin-2 [Streptomyces physcomitrii]|uniref:Mucin-2 n=1 Tax=Streptomyces physcomitrii TaxID=2724184 RepID=A0ABX1H7I8_9ACTN|nr:mucin-2 [Streptomyces physcomitrii]NKI44323.1 mucin-2 [Streptomyces physcomitrii]